VERHAHANAPYGIEILSDRIIIAIFYWEFAFKNTYIGKYVSTLPMYIKGNSETQAITTTDSARKVYCKISFILNNMIILEM